jgi:DNA topoisomerase-3
MKENGITVRQPELTLKRFFRRQYIIRNKTSIAYSNWDSTIDTIQNELVKLAELTGSWKSN